MARESGCAAQEAQGARKEAAALEQDPFGQGVGGPEPRG
jgi:hypothetical protein